MRSSPSAVSGKIARATSRPIGSSTVAAGLRCTRTNRRTPARRASSATGVDGNQANNSAANAGAAYVFGVLSTAVELEIARDGGSGCVVQWEGDPGFTYRLLRAPTVTGSGAPISTNTAPPSGLVRIPIAGPLSSDAFFRAVQP